MITREFSEAFAKDWIEAWNARDLDRILSHYAEDFEMSSPIIRSLVGEASGTLKGKPAVRGYWAKALAAIPDLRFELVNVFTGAATTTVCYRGHRGLAAEVFHFGKSGKVTLAFAHYAA